MTKIVRDDGSWEKAPSGATSGDLQAWRDRMHQECPNPKVGDIVVVVNEKQSKRFGYRAQTSDGYDTVWLRVSSGEIEKHLRLIDVKGDGAEPTTLADYVYLSDGVYVHKDDAWF